MGIRVDWDNEEQTVIRFQASGKWTWDDLFTGLDRVEVMSADVPHTVHAIIDLREADAIPSGMFFSFNGKKQAEKLASKADQSRGRIVIAGANGMIRSIFDTFRKFNRSMSEGVHFTDTLRQARAYLAQEALLQGEMAS